MEALDRLKYDRKVKRLVKGRTQICSIVPNLFNLTKSGQIPVSESGRKGQPQLSQEKALYANTHQEAHWTTQSQTSV
jgi:hypothetical protein